MSRYLCPPKLRPIKDISAWNMSLIYDDGLEVAGAEPDFADSALPGKDTACLIAAKFRDSAALFTVSTQQTLIVVRPKFKFIGFACLINRLITIDETDKKERMLLWILDLGRRNLHDLQSRVRFENVDELVRRFKVLRSFEDRGAPARWDWLKSRAVIVLRDPVTARADAALSEFTASHVLLEKIPAVWKASADFRALYGRDLERLSEGNYSIFMHESAARETGKNSPDSHTAQASGYFGHAQFTSGREPDRRVRGLELPFPGDEYEMAFRTVYVAAVTFLGLRRALTPSSIDGTKAVEQLQSRGFSLLRLEEFLTTNLTPRA